LQGAMNAIYFGVGALFRAAALLVTLAVPVRGLFRLQDAISARHIDRVCRVILICSLVVGYVYVMEVFMAYYSTSRYEGVIVDFRMLTGHGAFGMLLLCDVAAPQLFWFNRIRQNPWAAFAVCIAIDLGMLCQRYVVSTVIGVSGVNQGG